MNAALAAALTLSLAAGCSWAVVDKPPAVDPGHRPLSCTETSASAWIDAVVAAPLVIFGALLIYEGLEDRGSPRDYSVPAGITLLVLGTPNTLSAWYGFKHTGRCRRDNAREIRPGWRFDDWSTE